MVRELLRCPEYQMNSVSSPLILLPNLGIPYPTEYTFNEFMVRYVRGDLSMGGAGFPEAVWKWKYGMTRASYNLLVAFAGNFATGSALVYIHTPTNQHGGNAYVNYSAQMYLPVMTGKDGLPSERWIDAYQPVSVTFAGLVAI